MKPIKGLHTDSSPIDQPDGTVRFAKNIIDGGVLNALENEIGTVSLTTIPSLAGAGTTYIIGVIPTGGSAVLFLTNDTNSEIGVWQSNTYTSIYNDTELNFSTSNPIEGEYRINVNNQRIVSWIENGNTPRILNVDDIASVNSVADLDIFRDITNPSVTATINDTGGSLPTAAYIPITRYEGDDGSVSPWFVHDKTVYISDDASSLPFNEMDGADAGTTSNKSISLIFLGCDTRFETLAVGYIKVQGQVVTVHKVTEKPLASTTTVVVTGGEQVEEISLDEVLTSPSTYRIAKAITQVKGQLVLGNLTSEGVPDLQPYALGIEVNYTHTLVNVISNTSSSKDRYPQSFMPGEVYAFYLGVELLSGAWVFYHIPGRQAQAGETSSLSLSGLSYKKYQVEDTSNNGSASTNMGFWENEGEVYPNDTAYNGTSLGYEDLRAQSVRHHRFPSIRQVIAQHYSSDVSVGITHLPRLGISVSNVQIPSSVQSKIKRWKIFFAKKSQTDSVVLGSDLMQVSLSTDSDSTLRWTTGGNWEAEGEVSFSGSTSSFSPLRPLRYDVIHSHCLDFLYDHANANPVLAWFEYKLRRTNINTPWSGFRSSGGMFTRNNTVTATASAVIDYTVPTYSIRTNASSETIRRINNFKFLPYNSIDGTRSNINAEGNFMGEVQGSTTEISSGLLYNKCLTNPSAEADTNFLQGGTADEPTYNGLEDTWFMMYGRILSDVHSPFTSQDIIPTEQYATSSATLLNNIDGGDTFLCYMSYAAFGPLGEDYANGEYTGIRTWKAYIGYSRNNWNFRHEESGNIYTKYHGKTDVRELYTPFATVSIITATLLNISEADPNQLRYNPDYSTSNTFFSPLIFTPDLVNETQFSTTIIWSPTQGEETQEVSWRTFPSGNRWTMPKNRGQIINLQGVGNRDIIIHHERALFKTRTDTTISAEDGENIFLKSSDFFSVPPEEIVTSEEGYAGTLHKFSCKMTKKGYFFVDATQNKVFLYSGDKLNEISAIGMRDFFRDNLTNEVDNPFLGTGYTVVYDEQYERIILSKRAALAQFTLSYNAIDNRWVSFHSYKPNYMFRTYSNLPFLIDDLTIYSLGNGLRTRYFDDLTPNPSIVEVVFTSPETVVFDGAEWRAELFSSGTLITNQTANYITISTNDQTTSRTSVRLPSSIASKTANARLVHNKAMFNGCRDVSTNPGFFLGLDDDYSIDPIKINSGVGWFNKRKIIDKFAICRLEYVNSDQFLLYEITPIINRHER